MKPRNPYSEKPQTGVSFAGQVSRTKQAHKSECDINNIMARFQKTGAMTHFNRHSPSYGFATSDTFHEAMQTVQRAEQMFGDLPANLRRKFDNNPAGFLAFVQNPENLPEMIELGLAVKRPAPVSEEPATPVAPPA